MALPPARAGRPAPLAAALPADAGIDAYSLSALAADAARRAHQLLQGDGDGGLGLDRDADLARRASEMIGSAGLEAHRSPELEALAGRVGLSGQDLFRRALAWRFAGPEGIAVLAEAWQPDRDDLAKGRRALGAGVRAKDNRLTKGDRQLRFGTDGQWYPFVRSSGSWDPAGPAAFDPVETAASIDAASR